MSGDQNTLTIASTNTVVNGNGITFAASPSAYTTSNIAQNYYNLNLLNNCGTTNGNGNINMGFDSSNWKFSLNTGFAVFNTQVVFNNGLQVASGQTSYLKTTETHGLTNASSNITNNGDLINNGVIQTNNGVKHGLNSIIYTTSTTLSWPLPRVIFVNALVTPFTVTLPTLTSANNGLVITIRALPTCTQTVTIAFSSSQVLYLSNTSSSSTSHFMNGVSGPLHLTAINNYWMQV